MEVSQLAQEVGLEDHMKELEAKRDSLKVVLKNTISNLSHFVEQCKINPSNEVEGLCRFHQDRVMQLQVELRGMRQAVKEMQRAKLQGLRTRQLKSKTASPISIVDVLDSAVYTIIFPLIAEYNGERARLLPQVCKSWRSAFALTKGYWNLFTVTRPVKDVGRLKTMLSGAHWLEQLSLLFEDTVGVENLDELEQLLQSHTSLQSLLLVNPGKAFQQMPRCIPESLETLKIDSVPNLDVGAWSSIAGRLTKLKSLSISDAPAFSDEHLQVLALGLKSTLTDLSVTGCRNLRGLSSAVICQGCASLKSIHLSRSPVNAVVMDSITRLTGLEVLSITSSGRTESALVLDVARNCRALKEVTLFDVGPLQEEGLSRVVEEHHQLTALTLGPCNLITEDYLSVAVAKLPHLTKLCLANCSLISDTSLCTIADSLPHLEDLLLTDTEGFSDAGIFSLENCTQLKRLTLHPCRNVTSAGLMVLCDYCDLLEKLLLAECPAATEDTIVSMLKCCMHLEILMITHMPQLSEQGLSRMLESSNMLKCLALVPKSLERGGLLSQVAISRVHEAFPDAVVILEWDDLEMLLDVCIPCLESQPDMRHAVLSGLMVGGRQGSVTLPPPDDPTLMARRLVRTLTRMVGIDVNVENNGGAGLHHHQIHHHHHHHHHIHHHHYHLPPAAGAANSTETGTTHTVIQHATAHPAGIVTPIGGTGVTATPQAALLPPATTTVALAAANTNGIFSTGAAISAAGGAASDVTQVTPHKRRQALRIRMLREAIMVEMGNEDMPENMRILLEADAELEALEAGLGDRCILGGPRLRGAGMLYEEEQEKRRSQEANGSTSSSRDVARNGSSGSEGGAMEASQTKPAPEEKVMQRFLRLFPHLASARLLTHSRGRRATECALSSSILAVYHRLQRAHPGHEAAEAEEAMSEAGSGQAGADHEMMVESPAAGGQTAEVWPPADEFTFQIQTLQDLEMMTEDLANPLMV